MLYDKSDSSYILLSKELQGSFHFAGIGKNEGCACEVFASNMEKYIAVYLSNCNEKCKILLHFKYPFQLIPILLKKKEQKICIFINLPS